MGPPPSFPFGQEKPILTHRLSRWEASNCPVNPKRISTLEMSIVKVVAGCGGGGEFEADGATAAAVQPSRLITRSAKPTKHLQVPFNVQTRQSRCSWQAAKHDHNGQAASTIHPGCRYITGILPHSHYTRQCSERQDKVCPVCPWYSPSPEALSLQRGGGPRLRMSTVQAAQDSTFAHHRITEFPTS